MEHTGNEFCLRFDVYSGSKLLLHSYSDGSVIAHSLCFRVRLLSELQRTVESRDRRGGNWKNQTWIIARKLAQAHPGVCSEGFYLMDPRRSTVCRVWKDSICQSWLCESHTHFKVVAWARSFNIERAFTVGNLVFIKVINACVAN